MKKVKTIWFLGLLIFSFDIFSQEVLPEVKVTAVKYKYLSAVDSKDIPQPVKLLERKAAEFDVKSSEYYDDEYDEYFITFYIPAGYVLATYDKDGKLLRTAERFKNVALPSSIARAVANRYPEWIVSKDVYLVNYQEGSGATKVWKLLLEKGDRRLRVKANDRGEIID